MEFTLTELITAFGVSVLTGMALAVLYEPVRIFHKLGFSKSIHYFICDFLFMVVSAFITYFLCLAILEGCVRIFVIIGEILGFIGFGLLIHPIMNRIYDPFIKIFKKILLKLLKITRKVMYNIKSKSINVFKSIKSKVSDNVRKKRKRNHGSSTRIRNNKRNKTKKEKI